MALQFIQSGGASGDDNLPNLDFNDLDQAWEIWKLVEAVNKLGWTHLPNAGGVLDQDAALLDDLITIGAMIPTLKEQFHG